MGFKGVKIIKACFRDVLHILLLFMNRLKVEFVILFDVSLFVSKGSLFSKFLLNILDVFWFPYWLKYAGINPKSA